MSSRIHTTLALIASTLATTPLLAHPGHGTTDPQTVTHYAVEPMHVLPWLAVLVITVLTITLASRLHRHRTVDAASTSRQP